MYLVGAPHPNRERARKAMKDLASGGDRLLTSAEVLQEILHRYVAIARRDAIQPAFDVLLEIADEVLPVELQDVEQAKHLALAYQRLSARDCLHAAIMTRHHIERILSFDQGFDALPGILRIP